MRLQPYFATAEGLSESVCAAVFEKDSLVIQVVLPGIVQIVIITLSVLLASLHAGF